MATSKRKAGSAKKFGPRYGRTLKEKYGRIDAMQKNKYPCPVCNYSKVKRINIGIWKCLKCDAKFASKAYYVPRLREKSQESEEQIIESTDQTIETDEEIKE